MTDRLAEIRLTPFDIQIQVINTIAECSTGEVVDNTKALIYWLGQLQHPGHTQEAIDRMSSLAERRMRNLIDLDHQGIAQMVIDAFADTLPPRRASS